MSMIARRTGAAALAFLILTAAASSPSAAAGRTIVGSWTKTPGSCSRATALEIRAMSLIDATSECRFKSVRRTGDVVVWVGKCATMGEEVPTTVTASRAGERLTLNFGGASRQGPYWRCGK